MFEVGQMIKLRGRGRSVTVKSIANGIVTLDTGDGVVVFRESIFSWLIDR